MKRYMKIYEKMLKITIREMQIKHTMRYKLTPLRLVTIIKTKYIKCWQGHGIIGTLGGNVN